MPHVTDGELHMVLDGALELLSDTRGREVREHLEACDDCARRLEEERRVRQRSREVLDGAAPAADSPPPFGDIRERAGSEGAADPDEGAASEKRWSSGLRGLAWAASVVLALGLGWYAGGGPSGAGEEAGTGAARQMADAEATPAAEPGPSRNAPGPGAEIAAPSAGEREATPPPEGAPAATGGSMAVPGLPVLAVTWEASAGDGNPGLRVVQRLPAGDTLVLRYDPIGPAAVATAPAEARSDAATPPDAAAPSAATADPDGDAADRRGTGAEAAEADARLRARRRAPEPSDERSREPAPAADAAPAAESGGDAVVRLQRSTWSLEARAPVSADSLRVLLDRLPPPE